MYQEPCQTSGMELLTVNDLRSLAVFAEISIIDVSQGA